MCSVSLVPCPLSFLYYIISPYLPLILISSGIYDSTDCCLLMNHAMLLVGYGTDPTTGLDYWLAQNSWGTRWGEKGFMRLLRQEGTSAGVCGIMMSPVVAAGGMIESTGEGGRRFGRLEGVLSELHEHYWVRSPMTPFPYPHPYTPASPLYTTPTLTMIII